MIIINQLISIYDSPFKDSHSHPIHTCFPIIASNGILCLLQVYVGRRELVGVWYTTRGRHLWIWGTNQNHPVRAHIRSVQTRTILCVHTSGQYKPEPSCACAHQVRQHYASLGFADIAKIHLLPPAKEVVGR